MQIVIDIPEVTFESVKRYYEQNQECYALCAYVATGKPLPKGHGRLFDERDIVNGNYEIIGNKIYEVDPIIEADKTVIEKEVQFERIWNHTVDEMKRRDIGGTK